MSWMTYGVIIIFGAFVILMILNPNLSCFGRKITSPFYPLLRHNKKQQRNLETEDYGFQLSEEGGKKRVFSGQRMGEDEELFLDQFKNKKYRTKNYGFKLSDTNEAQDEKSHKGGG